MKVFKYLVSIALIGIVFGSCKKDEDTTEEVMELTPTGEVAINDDLVGVWKMSYNDYSSNDAVEHNDGTAGEITLTITASGTIISENVATIYNWQQIGESWETGGVTYSLEEESEYEILKFETTTLSSNRIKINGKPFYWYVEEVEDDVYHLDIIDTYNEVEGSFIVDESDPWGPGTSTLEYTIFPNTSFVKQ